MQGHTHRHLIDIAWLGAVDYKLIGMSVLDRLLPDCHVYRTSRDEPNVSCCPEVRNASFPGIPMMFLRIDSELR